jgi:3-oxoacyl-[acyl-carrier protein] reductase
MGDRYQTLVNTGIGRQVAGTVGLPVPERLRRHTPGDPLAHGPVLLGEAPSGHLAKQVAQALETAGVTVHRTADADTTYAAVIFDASGIADSTQLRALQEFFTPVIRSLLPSARLLVLGTPPTDGDARRRTAQRALEGFVRAAGKELRRGGTANLIYVGDGAESSVDSTLRFFVSGRSAYVSGQVVTLHVASTTPEPADWERPLEGKVALVTGAAQGIGAAIARTLARDGAHVVCLDIPSQGQQLQIVANDVGGETLQLDITAPDAPERISDHLRERHGGVDIVVHNAGVTRDKTLAGMDTARWDMVLDINLSSEERINDALLAEDLLSEHGRIVCVSSLSGIAGNRGQTNYAASKAGVIGMVEALAPDLAKRTATINAVAPGFIETAMTGKMPIGVREAGRRMNSVNQGGQPVDVAEAIAWFASPASAAVNGQVVRVCGQSLLGA